MAGEVIALRYHPYALDRLFAGESARLIVDYVLKELAPGRTAVVSSFGAESAALLHLVAQVDRATPVIFLDTLKHFPQTLSYRDGLVARLGLSDVRTIAPSPQRLSSQDSFGTLHAIDPDACCALRKVEPLAEAVMGFDALITGRKRHQAATRNAMPIFETDGDRRLKVNPLAEWREDDVVRYFASYDLPEHPLARNGYPSIGCAPCTTPVGSTEDSRAGRWRGADKTECGIHLSLNGQFVRVLAQAGGGC